MSSKLKEKYGNKPQATSSTNSGLATSSLTPGLSGPLISKETPPINPQNPVSAYPAPVSSQISSNGVSSNGSLAAVYTGKPKWLEMRLNEDLINTAATYNSSKSFFRPISDAFPVNNIIAAKGSLIPLGFGVQPFADDGEMPLVSYGSNTIPRCDSCKAYMSPFTKFLEKGYKFQCNICKFVDKVPDYYFSPLDENGTRADVAERPELSFGSYELKAGNE